MAGEAPPWRIRLSEAAESDFRAILTWTVEKFGERQARTYERTLSDAIRALAEGPDVRGAKRRDEIGEGLFTLHVARGRRKGRHFVLFRVGQGSPPTTIHVLRILHDSMDLARHSPSEGTEES